MHHSLVWLRGDGQIPVPVVVIRTLKPGEFDFHCINWCITVFCQSSTIGSRLALSLENDMDGIGMDVCLSCFQFRYVCTDRANTDKLESAGIVC